MSRSRQARNIYIAILCALLGGCSARDPLSSYERRTIVRGTGLDTAIHVYFLEFNELPVPNGVIYSAHASDFDVSANRVQAVLTQTEGRYFTQDPDAILDAWGTPFNIRFDGVGNGQVVVGEHIIDKRWAVWSSGQNEVNELGSGDDIIIWK